MRVRVETAREKLVSSAWYLSRREVEMAVETRRVEVEVIITKTGSGNNGSSMDRVPSERLSQMIDGFMYARL